MLYLIQINGCSVKLRYTFPSSLIRFAARWRISPVTLYCLLYRFLHVELFYESSGPDIGSRLAEQMQSRRGNHSETWLRCVSTASTLHWLRVEWWRHRCPPSTPSRENKFAGRTSSSSSSIPFRDTILTVPIKQTHVVHPSSGVSAFIAGTQLGHVDGKPICK